MGVSSASGVLLCDPCAGIEPRGYGRPFPASADAGGDCCTSAERRRANLAVALSAIHSAPERRDLADRTADGRRFSRAIDKRALRISGGCRNRQALGAAISPPDFAAWAGPERRAQWR